LRVNGLIHRRKELMELRHLRTFVTVAEELHFGKAGSRLHLTQPSISGQIARLEDELGLELLTRRGRQVALTDAGRAFLADAERIVRQADAASTNIRLWQCGGAVLRVGYVEDAFPAVLPVALRRLAALPDPPRIQLSGHKPDELLAQVRSDALDAAIVSLPAPVFGLEVTPFVYEQAAVAASVRALDQREEELPIETISDSVVLSRPRRTNPAFYDAVTAAFSDAGLPSPFLELEGVSHEELLLQAAAGAAVVLVPQSVGKRMRMLGVAFKCLVHKTAIGCELALVTAKPMTNASLALLRQELTESSRTSPTGSTGFRHEFFDSQRKDGNCVVAPSLGPDASQTLQAAQSRKLWLAGLDATHLTAVAGARERDFKDRWAQTDISRPISSDNLGTL
jgi:DNA-binding transcriptional LysR family regulator